MYGPWRQLGKFDPDELSLESATANLEPSMTQQHLGPETDINLMMRRYALTGELPVRRGVAEYGEFDEAMDYRTMIEVVEQGKRAFASVPSAIRARFENDPGQFLDWIHNEENYGEAESLGLVPKRDVAVETVVPAASAPVVGSEASA